MKIWQGVTILGFLALSAGAAQATQICVGCEWVDGAEATYLGPHEPASFDNSSFNHTDIGVCCGVGVPFSNLWVFDMVHTGQVSMQAAWTSLGSISDFMGWVYEVESAVCDPWPGSPVVGEDALKCSDVTLGAQLRNPSNDLDPDDNRIEFYFRHLGPGRYAFRIDGKADKLASAYSGNIATAVPEPGSLALLGLGLLGLGAARRRRA